MNISPHLEKLGDYIENEDFKGYDPYDALNSPLLRVLSLEKKVGRIAVIQIMRRLPFNIRPLMLIKKGHNPKGIGLFLWGYAKLYKVTHDAKYLGKINYLLELLEQLKSSGYSGNCWGYNFNWQSKAFYVPKWTPTIVNSSFIGHALLDTYEVSGNQKALDMAVSIKDFLLNDLNQTPDGDTFCFSYTPIDELIVHNANLLGASLLIRLHSLTLDSGIRDAALRSAAYSIKYQHEDGSWFYAETDFQRWIDSFHTGFNLQSISYFLDQGEIPEFKSMYERGVRFYAENFFLEDGTPKYYHNKVYPIDIHAPAMAIVFFSREGEKYRHLTERILSWMLKHLYDETHGCFYFRKGKYIKNKVIYMRWVQAWAFHALTEYTLQQKLLGKANER